MSADAIDALIAKLRNARPRCYRSQHFETEAWSGYLCCELEYGHPLPHRSGSYSWPPREVVVREGAK